MILQPITLGLCFSPLFSFGWRTSSSCLSCNKNSSLRTRTSQHIFFPNYSTTSLSRYFCTAYTEYIFRWIKKKCIRLVSNLLLLRKKNYTLRVPIGTEYVCDYGRYCDISIIVERGSYSPNLFWSIKLLWAELRISDIYIRKILRGNEV